MKINWKRVGILAGKEWAEMSRNKNIVWMMALLPIILVLLVWGTDFAIWWADAHDKDTDADEMPIPLELQHLPPIEAFIIQMNEQYMFYLFMMPMTLPIYIAAYGIIGEKESRTLEPLLATPISTWELLIGKSIMALAPSVLVTWLSYAVLLLGLIFLPLPSILAYLARPVWIVAMLLWSPLLALLSVLCGLVASSRFNDPRTAQQVSAVFIVPVIGLSMAVLFGKVFISVPMVLLAALVTLLIDLAVLYVAVRLFQRETILTRWK